MSRKHFQVIADHLALSRPEEGDFTDVNEYIARHAQWQYDVRVIGDALAADNERFDHDRFRQACGYGVPLFA